MSKEVKPGILTSEFWSMWVPKIIGALVMFGAMTSEQANDIQKAIGEVTGAVMIVSTYAMYAYTRMKAKMGG